MVSTVSNAFLCRVDENGCIDIAPADLSVPIIGAFEKTCNKRM